MATEKVAVEQKKLEPGGTAGCSDAPVHVKILQVSAKCLANTTVQPPPTAAGVPRVDPASTKVIPAVQSHQPHSSTMTVPGLQTSPSVVVITKVAASGGVSTNGQPQVTKTVLSQVAPINQVPTPGRTVMITVPRPAAPQTASPQLPANIQIPPGEVCSPVLDLNTFKLSSL